jgi:hypothetical protein
MHAPRSMLAPHHRALPKASSSSPPRRRHRPCSLSSPTTPPNPDTSSPPPSPTTLLAALHAERIAALSAATVHTRRADRLAPKLAALEAEALAAVKGGDEAAARAVLERKSAVVAAVGASRRRAGANLALATAVGVKMERVRRGG